MKIRLSIVCFSVTRLSALVALCLSIASCGLPVNSSKTVSISSGKSQAMDWLSAAQSNPSANIFKNSITQVRNSLTSTDIVMEYPEDNGACADEIDGITLAYVKTPTETSDINVCSIALEYSNEILAQVLIHESIHIAGVEDECGTTYIETHIVHFAGQKPFENGYVESCGGSYDFSDISFSTFSDDFNAVSGWNPFKFDFPVRY